MTTSSPAYFQWLRQQQTIKYCRVAPISIWMFDYILTFNEEVHLLTSPGGWDALVTTRPLVTCVALYRFAEIILFLGMFAAEGLLLIRTRALVVIYCIAGIVMFICCVISTTLKFQAICAETTSSVTTAFATALSRATVGMFSSAAFFELVVLALTLLHGYMLRQTSAPISGKVVGVVTQGNMVYTLSIFLTSIANMTFFLLPLQDGWDGLLATFQGVLHGVVASRILFDLRDVLRSQGDTVTFTVSSVQFAAMPRNVAQIELATQKAYGSGV